MRDPFASLTIHSLTDPAITFASDDDRAKYAATRDASLVKVKQGAKPVAFTIKRIDAAFACSVLDAIAGANSRAIMAFRAAVTRVEMPTGEPIEPDPRKLVDGVYGQKFAGEEYFSKVSDRVGPKRALEIGDAAYRLSMLDDEAHDPLG